MAKKSFTDSPALQFITAAPERSEPEPKPTQPKTAPTGYKPDYRYIEKRSKRVQILITPSLYEAIRAEAERSGTSANDIINTALEKAVRKD